MSTWNQYKADVKAVDGDAAEVLSEIEAKSAIVSAIIRQRDALGLSQRDLAALCDIPQSTVARIESNRTSPNLDTLLKMLRQIGLTLTVTSIEPALADPAN